MWGSWRTWAGCAAESMRARINPFLSTEVVPHPSRGPVRAFHRSLSGYAPTPLYNCRQLAAELGVGGLLIKDEGQRFGLGAFKVLGASWALHLIRQRRPGTKTVATATDGNHGHAVAWAAAQLGISAVVFIPADAAPARIERIRGAGAQVMLVQGTYDEAVRRCAESSAGNGWQVVADVGYEGYLDIPRLISEGYSTLFEEAFEQVLATGRPEPNLVLVQAGVGGLLHAAVDHYRALTIQPVLVAVEPVESDPLLASIDSADGVPTESPGRQNSIMAGLNCGRVSLAAWPTVRRGVELFLTVTDDYAEEAMRRLARPSGDDPPIVAGESGAAGLGGLLALLQAPEFTAAREFLHLGGATQVLLINTEGATDPAGYARVVRPETDGRS